MKTMKTNFLKFSLIATICLGFVSCGDDDLSTDDGPDGPDVIVGTVLQGNITQDLLVPTGNYTLKGAVVVKDGATLTIEEGSTFTVTAADQAAGINLLIVEQGGKLI